MPRTIAVLGRSIGGQLAACYLKKKLPHLRVVLVGPESNTLPVVGESTIEATTFFLQELGLLGYLSEQQLHKTGLTFYFKKHLDDPRDRCYAVHEQPATPPLPSFQLNRFSFAVALEELCARLGVERRDGRARSITQHGRARFRIAITGAGDESLAAHWVLDCTGRARFLARRYGLQRRAPVQRCSFWLRLSGFDRDFLSRISAEKPRQCSYDSYFATHHFFGKGNWIWVIPLKGDQGRLVSIGITWRPDLFPGTVRSVEDFIA
jgi:2-polyprenyl-6-methoxyphenol hydroxylase-like FAD-dependent oxidoreductase